MREISRRKSWRKNVVANNYLKKLSSAAFKAIRCRGRVGTWRRKDDRKLFDDGCHSSISKPFGPVVVELQRADKALPLFRSLYISWKECSQLRRCQLLDWKLRRGKRKQSWGYERMENSSLLLSFLKMASMKEHHPLTTRYSFLFFFPHVNRIAPSKEAFTRFFETACVIAYSRKSASVFQISTLKGRAKTVLRPKGWSRDHPTGKYIPETWTLCL